MRRVSSATLAACLLLILAVLPLVSCAGNSNESIVGEQTKVTLNVSAAASLTDALTAVDSLYTADNPGVTIDTNFAGSGTLQQQIENGAPADVFISAAPAQMDALQKEQLILNDTRNNLLGNQVVLIVPKVSTLDLTSFQELLETKVSKVAIGDPKFVPVGMYAQKVFEEFGMWTQLQSKFVLGSDVRQVLAYVESDNVDAGVVYATDAAISNGVKIVATGPEDINAAILYPVAVVKASKNPDAAKAYENFLFSSGAKAVFEKYGFVPK